MEKKKISLVIEINNSNYIFAAVEQNENQNFNIIEKIITPSEGIIEKKFTNSNASFQIIKKNIEKIENKLSCVFKTAIIILGDVDLNYINISGHKRMNGSQILKENISYIINDLRSLVTKFEKDKKILHIFNTKSVLDGTILENLPIGLFGNFYIHELSFLALTIHQHKNIEYLFNKNNIEIKRIFARNFIEGTQLIEKENNIDTFFKIKISKEHSNIFYFENSSLKYIENYKFGTNIILKDIKKVCSLDINMVEKFLSKKPFQNNIEKEENLEIEYFKNINFRKIKKNLIKDIANARIEELSDIIFHKNINITSFKEKLVRIYLSIDDKLIGDNFEKDFKIYLSGEKSLELKLIDDFSMDKTILNVANIASYGWKKEAIPIKHKKYSLISRFFRFVFE